jgi:hypothetical protein
VFKSISYPEVWTFPRLDLLNWETHDSQLVSLREPWVNVLPNLSDFVSNRQGYKNRTGQFSRLNRESDIVPVRSNLKTVALLKNWTVWFNSRRLRSTNSYERKWKILKENRRKMKDSSIEKLEGGGCLLVSLCKSNNTTITTVQNPLCFLTL